MNFAHARVHIDLKDSLESRLWSLIACSRYGAYVRVLTNPKDNLRNLSMIKQLLISMLDIDVVIGHS